MTNEIEVMKGQLQRMADQIAYSTIVVNIRATAPVAFRRKAPEYPFPWLREINLDNLLRVRP